MPCVLFLAVTFGATKAEMDLINFGHTARLYVERREGVVKEFEVGLPATAAGKATSMGSHKTLEAALELRDVARRTSSRWTRHGTSTCTSFQRDLLAAHNVGCH